MMAMIRLEVGEQTTEIRKSINELRSFQGCCQDGIRRDEATIRGPRILGSQEDLELKGDEATKKVYALSATLAKKEEKRAGVEERFREYVKRANSGGRALDPKQNPRGAPEVSLLKAQLRYRKQALIDIRRSAHCHQEEAERERDRLAQELLEVRAVKREQDKAPRGEWAAGDVAKNREQVAMQQEQDQGVGQLDVRLGEPEA